MTVAHAIVPCEWALPSAGFVVELCICECLPVYIHHHTHYTQYHLTQLQNMTKC